MDNVVLKSILLKSIFLILSTSNIFCKNYYVNSIAGSDSNPGTSVKKPWKSFYSVHAMDFKPGDIINFARGSSWIDELIIKDSGTKEKPIFFRTYGKGYKPEISNPSPANYVVEIKGSWIILDGFKIKDSRNAAVRINSGANHNIVQNCEITNAGMGIGAYGSYNLFTRNYVHDLNMIVNTPKAINSDDDHGAVAFWMFGPNNEISYNKAANCKAPSYDYEFDGGFFEIYGNGDSTYVHNNWAEYVDGFFEFGAGRRGGSSKDIVISYNVSINNDQFGVFHLGQNFNNPTENLRIENNTIVQTEKSRGGYIFWFGIKDLPPNILSLRNNIIVRDGKGEIVVNNGDFIHENNIYYLINNAQVGYDLGKNEIIADPLFVDMGNHNFRITAESPARNAGVNLGHNSDMDEILIPEAKAPDIGAYEYVNTK